MINALQLTNKGTPHFKNCKELYNAPQYKKNRGHNCYKIRDVG